MRTFKLVRDEDVSGVSGVGEIAEGVEFHDGQCVLSWFGQHHTIEVLPHLDDIVDIHGHGGATRVVFDSDENRKLSPVEMRLNEMHEILFGGVK